MTPSVNPGIPDPASDWQVYADATCAGLSVLIPLPLVDLAFEVLFRRRIPQTIVGYRKAEVAPGTRRQFVRSLSTPFSLEGCLTALVAVVKYLARRIWRKIIYIFAVKDAVTALTEYWHRAVLLDHMVRIGHLGPGADIGLAARVFSGVLRDIDPSPLSGLARETVANANRVVRLLLRARRLGAEEVTRSIGEVMSSHWRLASTSLEATTHLYNVRYAADVALAGTGNEPSNSKGD
jgi:hypothetical protein